MHTWGRKRSEGCEENTHQGDPFEREHSLNLYSYDLRESQKTLSEIMNNKLEIFGSCLPELRVFFVRLQPSSGKLLQTLCSVQCCAEHARRGTLTGSSLTQQAQMKEGCFGRTVHSIWFGGADLGRCALLCCNFIGARQCISALLQVLAASY